MKKLLSYLIIIQFWLAPFGTIHIAHAQNTEASCAAQGRVLSPGGMCQESAATSTSRAATSGCMAIEDPEQQKECYAQTAHSGLQGSVNSGDTSDREGSVKKQPIIYNIATISSIVLAGVLFQNLKAKKSDPSLKNCKSLLSIKLMLAGSIAAVVAEVAGNIHFKSKVRKALKDYKEDVTVVGTEDSRKFKTSKSDGKVGIEAQSRAFDYLIDKEKAFKTAATIKAAGYITSAALYGAAGIYSVIEAGTQKAAQIAEANGYPTPEDKKPHQYDCHLKSEELKLNAKEAAKKTSEDLLKGAGGAASSVSGGNDGAGNDSNQSTTENSSLTAEEQNIQDNQERSENNGFGTDEEASKRPDKSKVNEKYDNLWEDQRNTSLELNLDKSLDENHIPANVDRDEVRKMMDVFITMANNILMGNAYAQGYGGGKEEIDEDANIGKDLWTEIKGLLMAAAGSVMIILTMKKMIHKGLAKPIVRIGFSAAMGGYAGYVSSEHIKEAKIAQERIEELEKIRDLLKDPNGSGITDCPVDDQDCKLRTAGGGGKYEARDQNDYDANFGDSRSPKYCLDKTNRMDPKCKCRQKKSCKKIVGNLKLPGVGQTSWLKGLSAGANSMTNGGLGSSGKLEGITNSAKNAIKKIAALKKKLRKKKKYGPFMRKGKKYEKQITKGLGNMIKRGVANGSIRLGSGMSSGSAPTTAAGALVTIKKDIAKAKVEKSKMIGGKARAGVPKGEDDLDFGFGDEDELGGVFDEEFEDAMDKDFEYGENDIYPNKDEDIFKVLSSRYQRSGLKRLFDDENKFQSDEASDTEIHGTQ